MVYLLYGEDEYLKDNFLKKLKKSFGEIVNGINYIAIGEENVNEIIPNIETPAFGYEKKMIVAKNTKLFTRKSKKNASDNNIENTEANNKNVDRLVEYSKENSIDDVELVFVEETCEKNSLFNLISKIGQVKEFKELGVNELLPEIRKIASMYKVNIDNYTASYFIECVGNNMQDIINEIRKLIEYVGEGGTIKKEDIDSLTIKKTTSIIFDLTDTLGQKNIKKAIETLHNLQYNKEPTQVIIVMLYRHFKKLYFVHLCKGQNLVKNLNLTPKQEFLANKYKRQASYFKEAELERILFEIINLDEKSKNGNINLDVGLEAVLCNYCSK